LFAPAWLHDLVHRIAGLDYPHDHWWLDLMAALVFVVAPTWTVWLLMRFGLRTLRLLRRGAWRAFSLRAGASPQPIAVAHGAHGKGLERYVLEATCRFQFRLIFLSLLTLPAAWFLLEIPKHIINHALTDANGDGYAQMTILGSRVGRLDLLLLLCCGYLGVLTVSFLLKLQVNRARGRVNERLVRRLRLAVLKRAQGELTPSGRATLSTVAMHEVEPVGYFGSALVAVPVVQGGALATSILFLFLQNAALALAALIMLPVQVVLLPRLQRRLNAKVRERVHATRALGGSLTAADHISTSPEPSTFKGDRVSSALRKRMRQVEVLERVRIEINDLKGLLKGLYNFTSNLTPFFFFSIGGYLVVQGRLSLGALVAALAAYKEIAPALRELFDFAQSWSDARSRFSEVIHVIRPFGNTSYTEGEPSASLLLSRGKLHSPARTA
jgi:ABC-type multidrug transport system fused ATPase/permease subunit